MIPLVAIVGRPNVGKSTLFNRLVGKSLAIVKDEPGVTRDRHYADAHLQGRDLLLVDTGGFDPEAVDRLDQGVFRHVQAAIREADVVVCVLDGRGTPTGADEANIALLRKSEKPTIYVANRVDNPEQALASGDLYRLGLDNLFPISALHGRGMAEFEAALVDALPVKTVDEARDMTRLPKIALIGRPNAGKSSLLNRLVGDERSLVDDRPGTTRDPVDAEIVIRGEHYEMIDTAGIRRKAKIDEDVESASVLRAIRIINQSRIVVLMTDGTGNLSDQDQRLLALAVDRGRAVLIGLNKVDLLSKDELKKQSEGARDQLHFAPWVPVVHMSAKTGSGVKTLLDAIHNANREFTQRVPPALLNRFFAEILDRQPPPTHKGRAPRLYYITQADVAPPTFVIMCSASEAIKTSYKRFVINQIRKNFQFTSVPLRVRFRGKKRAT
jgi:GTP-binding protein